MVREGVECKIILIIRLPEYAIAKEKLRIFLFFNYREGRSWEQII